MLTTRYATSETSSGIPVAKAFGGAGSLNDVTTFPSISQTCN
ncbi:MAG: hypothetical protein ACFFAZ_06150 [Promethearchaeota archaeon]